MSDKKSKSDKSDKSIKSDKKKGVEEEHDMLDDISHALLRPDMYIGTTEASMQTMWIYDEDSDKFSKSDINFSPGL
jgi:DNA topoisomerase-2